MIKRDRGLKRETIKETRKSHNRRRLAQRGPKPLTSIHEKLRGIDMSEYLYIAVSESTRKRHESALDFFDDFLSTRDTPIQIGDTVVTTLEGWIDNRLGFPPEGVVQAFLTFYVDSSVGKAGGKVTPNTLRAFWVTFCCGLGRRLRVRLPKVVRRPGREFCSKLIKDNALVPFRMERARIDSASVTAMLDVNFSDKIKRSLRDRLTTATFMAIASQTGARPQALLRQRGWQAFSARGGARFGMLDIFMVRCKVTSTPESNVEPSSAVDSNADTASPVTAGGVAVAAATGHSSSSAGAANDVAVVDTPEESCTATANDPAITTPSTALHPTQQHLGQLAAIPQSHGGPSTPMPHSPMVATMRMSPAPPRSERESSPASSAPVPQPLFVGGHSSPSSSVSSIHQPLPTPTDEPSEFNVRRVSESSAEETSATRKTTTDVNAAQVSTIGAPDAAIEASSIATANRVVGYFRSTHDKYKLGKMRLRSYPLLPGPTMSDSSIFLALLCLVVDGSLSVSDMQGLFDPAILARAGTEAVRVQLPAAWRQRYIFPSSSGIGMSSQGINSRLKELSFHAGFEQEVTTYAFRHRVVWACFARGISVRVIKDLLGHKAKGRGIEHYLPRTGALDLRDVNDDPATRARKMQTILNGLRGNAIPDWLAPKKLSQRRAEEMEQIAQAEKDRVNTLIKNAGSEEEQRAAKAEKSRMYSSLANQKKRKMDEERKEYFDAKKVMTPAQLRERASAATTPGPSRITDSPSSPQSVVRSSWTAKLRTLHSALITPWAEGLQAVFDAIEALQEDEDALDPDDQLMQQQLAQEEEDEDFSDEEDSDDDDDDTEPDEDEGQALYNFLFP